MTKEQKAASLETSKTIEDMPLACSNEMAAVEFFERQMWHGTPRCPHCQSTAVYKMMDATMGQRSKRFLWRCRGCNKQFTVRVGTVLEESRIPLRHWAYAFWRAATSKKGVAALEIKRQCQISHKAPVDLGWHGAGGVAHSIAALGLRFLAGSNVQEGCGGAGDQAAVPDQL